MAGDVTIFEWVISAVLFAIFAYWMVVSLGVLWIALVESEVSGRAARFAVALEVFGPAMLVAAVLLFYDARVCFVIDRFDERVTPSEIWREIRASGGEHYAE